MVSTRSSRNASDGETTLSAVHTISFKPTASPPTSRSRSSSPTRRPNTRSSSARATESKNLPFKARSQAETKHQRGFPKQKQNDKLQAQQSSKAISDEEQSKPSPTQTTRRRFRATRTQPSRRTRDPNVEIIRMNTGILYIYRGKHRKAKFVPTK